MKFFGLLACLFLFYSSISFAQKLSSNIDTISYAAGLSIAEDLKSRNVTDLNPDIFTKAFKSAMKNEKMQINKDTALMLFTNYMIDLRSKEGRLFLEANAKKAGVTVLPSGLQYEVLVKGAGGQKPVITDKVKTHYHGMLTNNDVFDSSVSRGEPVSYGLDQVIPGWTEGLQLMSVGDKYKFYIPHHLAYGERGAGNVIPPYATLIFEVELLGINVE